MKEIKQRELLCRIIWAHMRTLEEYDGYDLDGNKYDSVERLKKNFDLADKDIKDINKMGKDLKLELWGKPVICNL